MQLSTFLHIFSNVCALRVPPLFAAILNPAPINLRLCPLLCARGPQRNPLREAADGLALLQGAALPELGPAHRHFRLCRLHGGHMEQ